MEKIDNAFTTLYQSYESKPIIKALIQCVGVGAAVDSMLSTYVANMRALKLRIFFDQLDNGDIALTEEKIRENDFLHAYFSTVNYVLRNRSDLKIKAFAEILKSLYQERIDINEFEDYVKIFDELTEREFVILSVKYDFEKKAATKPDELNPAQRTSSYWQAFKADVKVQLDIDDEELNAMLVRIQRTGCYKKHKGYWDESHEEEGNTTNILRIILRIINHAETDQEINQV